MDTHWGFVMSDNHVVPAQDPNSGDEDEADQVEHNEPAASALDLCRVLVMAGDFAAFRRGGTMGVALVEQVFGHMLRLKPLALSRLGHTWQPAGPRRNVNAGQVVKISLPPGSVVNL